ncbi:MAG: branched-chain amino acid ABC transporter permease [Alphaproteobacteria bacterium HGW-Alphaproteobacteria-2]|nr:MAG: branched-chain amino acid ABC transporter permease [Alphaproteobacteria bacterium HGW-Alphaproteobacteria-2]
MIAFLVTILTLVAIAAILALALNLQWGLCGMVNFGLVGFFALGAYAAALLSLAGAGPALALLGAMVITAACGAAVAALSHRLAEEYLAIVTLGFGEVVRLTLLNESWLTGGALGLPGIPSPTLRLPGPGGEHVGFLVLCLIALALAYLVVERLARAPFGRLMRAVRDDDVVAATLGKDVVRVRIAAFAIGCALLALGGALHAWHFGYIDPSQFTPIVTAYAFMAVIAGGRGSNPGILVGAGVVMLLIEGSRFLKDVVDFVAADQLAALRLILIGAGLILFLIYRPQGLGREYRRSAASFPTVPAPASS